MKVSKVSKITSLIICSIIILIVPITVVDYMRVKNEKEPIFCLTREEKTVEDVSTFICKGFIYKYYETTNNKYISKSFIPLWKALDGTYE